jgi:NADH-quinone oxidoreductase subunit K
MMQNIVLNWFFVAIVAFCGFYCLIISRNMLRLLIGVELLAKAGILAIIVSGSAIGNVNMAQAMIAILIVIEVVVVAVGLGLIVKNYTETGNIDIWKLNRLKG